MSVGTAVSALPATLINTATDTNGGFLYGADYRGAYFLLTVSGFAATFAITDLKVQVTNDGGTTWFTIKDWNALAISANGTFVFCMYPGATDAAALKAAPSALPLPAQFRVVLTSTAAGGSATCSVLAFLLP